MADNISVLALLDEPRVLFSINTHWLFTLTPRPLKWLRYVSYAVIGLEGVLQKGEEGDTVDDYEVTEGLLERYYFKPEGSLSSISDLVIDPSAIRSYHAGSSSTSSSSPRDDRFMDLLLTRDGDRCVFSGSAMNTGAHLIPYMKGDKYVDILTTTRAAAKYAEDDPLRLRHRVIGIDDLRNAILVSKNLHHHLYRVSDQISYSSALLPTPNFAMDPADVPSPPNACGAERHAPTERLTLQFLRNTRSRPVAPADGVPNSDAQVPYSMDSDDAPSRIILDYLYGATVLKVMGDPRFIEFASAHHPLPAFAAENAAMLEGQRRERKEKMYVQEGSATPPKDWNTRVEDAVAGLWFSASIPARLAMAERIEAEEKEKASVIGAWAQQCASAEENEEPEGCRPAVNDLTCMYLAHPSVIATHRILVPPPHIPRIRRHPIHQRDPPHRWRCRPCRANRSPNRQTPNFAMAPRTPQAQRCSSCAPRTRWPRRRRTWWPCRRCMHTPSGLALDDMYDAAVLRVMGDPVFVAFARAGHPLPENELPVAPRAADDLVR